jgi:hypothetical protein
MNLSDDDVARLPLHHGRAELLEEIMRTPVLDDRPTAPAPTPRRNGWLVPAAAAAAVAVLVAGTAWWASGHGPDAERSPQIAQAPAPGSYRAVLDAPGWKVDNVYAETDDGELTYSKGDQQFDVTWYPASSYDDYVEDRRHITDPPADGVPIEVLGRGAQMWAYGAQDHAAIREVEDGHWLELRGSGMGKAAYLALLDQLRLVDQAGFEASMPGSFVDGSERQAAVDDILAGIRQYVDPLIPPHSQRIGFSSDQADPYHLGADVAGEVACEWLAEFEDAHRAGNQQRMDRAVAALGTSRDWPILKQMEQQGEYSEVIWDYADLIAAGDVPEGYASGLGCEG